MKFIHIKIFAPTKTEKSALLRCLESDKYQNVTRQIENDPQYQTTINGVSINISICDVLPCVVIIAFDIDKLNTRLQSQIDIMMCRPREDFERYRPILLVGLKSELRQENPQEVSLFPFEFGQCLAHLVGAVKYVECSTKLNQGVIEVFDEAIRASFQYHCFGVVYSDLKNVLVPKITMADAWTDVITNIKGGYSQKTAWMFDSINHLLDLDKQLYHVVSKQPLTLKDFSACRSLEVETIQLANNPVYCLDNIKVKYTEPRSILWCTDQLFHVTTSNTKDLAKEVSLLKEAVSLQFVKQDCRSINELIRTCAPMTVKSLVIISCTGTLVLDILPKLEGLENLFIIDTQVDLHSLEIPPNTVSSLKRLMLKQCDLKQITRVGGLTQLENLDVTCNRLTSLPQTLGNLDFLQILRFDGDRVVFPPTQVLRKTVQGIVQFLKEFHNEPTANKEAKMIVVGQGGVGKSTLTERLKKSRFSLGKTTRPTKTDGVDISVLKFKTSNCSVYDMAGDVEYLNTHVLFFSPNCLHLVVFDLSQLPVSKEIRSSDQFCRLELWLQTIACQDQNSYAIVVGTHADHQRVSSEIRARLRSDFNQLVDRYRSSHASSTAKIDGCMLCDKSLIDKGDTPEQADGSVSGHIPHILGYHEVSGITGKNVKILKRQLKTSIANIKTYTSTDNIPRKWLDFRQETNTRLSNDDTLKTQPIVKLSQLDLMAYVPEGYVAMLRFFHSQGDFLWYEDIPEMKDVVILDPQWLSNQLRTLISYRSDVNNICEGVLHHSMLPKVWCDMSTENRSKLISLFRSVGLCFSISEMEELFPCKLPIGWPDRDMWSPLPKPNENQTTLLFSFSFLPPSFSPDLIVAINTKRGSFPSKLKPCYYRFNVMYITKDQSLCPLHVQEREMETSDEENNSDEPEQLSRFHRIHFDLMPYNNSMKVTVRGPRPCCMIPDIRSTIEMVKSRRYPGISYQERLVFPECEMKKVHNPDTLELDGSCEGLCSKGHNIGSIQHVLSGKLSSSIFVPGKVGQTGRTVGETLEDHFCPKLFVVLPINLDSLPLLDRFVHSYLRDGYAVHLLCESPDEWHFVSSPGFRVGKPKEFFKKYGGRVCKVLRVISALGTPFQIASAVEPHCRVGAPVAKLANNISEELKALLEDYLDKYPHLKTSLGSPNDDLKYLKSSRGLQRSELSRFLNVAAKGHDFRPLTCTYVDRCDEWLWLCEEHNQKYEIVER